MAPSDLVLKNSPCDNTLDYVSCYTSQIQLSTRNTHNNSPYTVYPRIGTSFCGAVVQLIYSGKHGSKYGIANGAAQYASSLLYIQTSTLYSEVAVLTLNFVIIGVCCRHCTVNMRITFPWFI